MNSFVSAQLTVYSIPIVVVIVGKFHRSQQMSILGHSAEIVSVWGIFNWTNTVWLHTMHHLNVIIQAYKQSNQIHQINQQNWLKITTETLNIQCSNRQLCKLELPCKCLTSGVGFRRMLWLIQTSFSLEISNFYNIRLILQTSLFS